MKISSRIVLPASVLVVLSLAVPLLASAQMRTAPMTARPVAAVSTRSARPVATHVAPVARPRVVVAAAGPAIHGATAPFIPPANGSLNFGNGFNFDNGFYGGSGETIQQLLDPVPGLGFDYSYLAGIDKDLALQAIIDPQTEERLAVAERVARSTSGFGASAYYLLGGGGEYVVPAETAANEQTEQPQQPEVIVLQQAAQKTTEETAAAPQPAQPIPDVGNFILVLRNGHKIQVIAFTRSSNSVIYITRDGSRHTIAASELDDVATQRINQDSGTELTL